MGYWKSALLFGALIAVVFALHRFANLNAVFAFWVAYILTRPLGASIGDYLSQPRADGGLGLGTTVTSVIFLLTILGVVVYLSLTKLDRIERDVAPTAPAAAVAGLAGHPHRHEQDDGDACARRRRARSRRCRRHPVRAARTESRASVLRPEQCRPLGR